MSMGKRRTATGAEYDATSQWGRRYLIYIGRTGVRSSIKRGMRRRERHEGKPRNHQDDN